MSCAGKCSSEQCFVFMFLICLSQQFDVRSKSNIRIFIASIVEIVIDLVFQNYQHDFRVVPDINELEEYLYQVFVQIIQ